MNIESKLEEIKIENIILFIYFILLLLYYYGNTLETRYLKYQNELDKEKYRIILYIVFGATFIITLMYSISALKELEQSTNKNNELYRLKELSAVGNLLALFATVIYLYIIYKDKDIDLEVTM